MDGRNLIFDLDGTLVDSAPSILACMKTIISDAGYKPLRPLDSSLIGPPLMATLSNVTGLFDEIVLFRLAENFKERYDDIGLRSTRPYLEIPYALRRLHECGSKLHLATNKRMGPTRSILELLGWSEWFTSIYTQDMQSSGYSNKTTMIESQLRDNNIDPAAAVYIGDTREDGIASAANGVHFLAVEWGYGDFNGWPGVGSWTRIATPLDLLSVLSCKELCR